MPQRPNAGHILSRLRRGPSYPPGTLELLCHAYDGAWAKLSSDVGDDPQSVDEARTDLAKIILSFPRNIIRTAQQVKMSSLEIVALRKLCKLEPASLVGHSILIVETRIGGFIGSLQFAIDKAGGESLVVRHPGTALQRCKQFKFSAAAVNVEHLQVTKRLNFPVLVFVGSQAPDEIVRAIERSLAVDVAT